MFHFQEGALGNAPGVAEPSEAQGVPGPAEGPGLRPLIYPNGALSLPIPRAWGGPEITKELGFLTGPDIYQGFVGGTPCCLALLRRALGVLPRNCSKGWQVCTPVQTSLWGRGNPPPPHMARSL